MGRVNLHDFQQRALEHFESRIAAGAGKILMVSPTGSGKTVIAAELMRRCREAGQRSLFLAPRRELIAQASAKLEALGVPHGIILAGDPRSNLHSMTQVASVDTLRVRRDRIVLPDPRLIVIDEAHLYATKIRQELLNRWPSATRLGLTATPCRRDGRGLGMFDELTEAATVAQLTAAGILCPARYFSIAEPDLRKVRIVAGDYQRAELAQAMTPLVADIPATWLERAAGRRTAVFAVNVAHSVALRDAFLVQGVAAEHVDGATPLGERAAIFDRFARGVTQVLTNCSLVSYGYDLPVLDCIVLARPTRSLALYLQMIGRGLRSAPAKRDCLVLDHSGAVHRHGFAIDERAWSLDGHADLAASSRRAQERDRPHREESKQLDCPDCKAVFSGTRTCPECGYYFAPKGRMIRALEGELVEVGAQLGEAQAGKLAFYLELRGFASERSYASGWAAHKFKEKHGHFPPWSWNDLAAASPSLETRRWIRSRIIAYAKARERERIA